LSYQQVASVASVVEGHGETAAIPTLIKRIAQSLGIPVTAPNALRGKRSQLVTEEGIKRAVSLAAVTVVPPRRVLVVVDADGECPAELGPRLQAWAQAARADVPCAVVIAKQEYEAWLIAGATGLSSQRGLPAAIERPVDPEGIQGAKEWITRQMPKGRVYKPTLDQAALTSVFDIGDARECDSFDKCYREIERLLTM
jgi:hypothetical protein